MVTAHLVRAHGDGLLQQEPHNALLAGRRGEGAMVGPVVPAGREQAGWVEVREGCLLALGREQAQAMKGRMRTPPLPHRLTLLGEWISNAIEKAMAICEQRKCLSEVIGRGGRPV